MDASCEQVSKQVNKLNFVKNLPERMPWQPLSSKSFHGKWWFAIVVVSKNFSTSFSDAYNGV